MRSRVEETTEQGKRVITKGHLKSLFVRFNPKDFKGLHWLILDWKQKTAPQMGKKTPPQFQK